MVSKISGPIPGQSLTDTPKNYPWERPPETVVPEEAIKIHLDHMAKPAFMDSTIFLLEMGLPVEVLTNTTITLAVAEGLHSIDVGLIIAPVIHKEIVSIADMAGIEYEEFFSEEAEEEEVAKARVKAKVMRKLKNIKDKGTKAEVSETIRALSSEQTEEFEEMREEQEPMDSLQPPPQEPQGGMGLMSRGA
jgi:hypothetical protein